MAKANQNITAKVGRVVTMERLTEDLEKARQMAHEKGQADAAVSACVAMAELHGLLVKRTRVETTTAKDMPDEEIEERRRHMLIERVRTNGRDHLVEQIAECQNLLAIYDAGEFEEWAAQGALPTKH